MSRPLQRVVEGAGGAAGEVGDARAHQRPPDGLRGGRRVGGGGGDEAFFHTLRFSSKNNNIRIYM